MSKTDQKTIGVTISIIVTAIFFCAMFALFSRARASESECYSIRDYDKRLECIAIERREPADCTSIRDPDQRAICRQRARRF